MRNLILSAFPRNMRLPDPFTPNLKVDLLPEINQSPRFVPEPQNLLPAELRCDSNPWHMFYMYGTTSQHDALPLMQMRCTPLMLIDSNV